MPFLGAKGTRPLERFHGLLAVSGCYLTLLDFGFEVDIGFAQQPKANWFGQQETSVKYAFDEQELWKRFLYSLGNSV